MTISAELGERVRLRATFAFEYCGVSETDSGGKLTVDHFHPRSRGGNDDLVNLLYCCYRCNLHKADYWPTKPGDPVLWNPRREPMGAHLRLLPDGALYPLTPTGEFTLKRLRLNRPQLVGYRLRRIKETDKQFQDARRRELLALFDHLHQLEREMLEEQRALLEDLKDLLSFLLKDYE